MASVVKYNIFITFAPRNGEFTPTYSEKVY